jgi:hypothetical protein
MGNANISDATVSDAQWNLTEELLPSQDALIWADGRYMVASFVDGIRDGKKWQVFMDTRTDDLLPWPTHWMSLPRSPGS